MEECIFCKIAKGTIPAKRLAEDAELLAFPDIDPQAPVHVLVIPKQHVASLEEITRLPERVARRLFEVSSMVAQKLGVRESGYAIRINNGSDAGQEVFHLHLHLLGGQRIGMP